MNALFDTLGTHWGRTLWAVSWQVSIVIGFVWLLSLLSRKASPVFRYWLWCIVLLRLCLPIDLKAPLGVGHYFRSAAEVPLTGLVRTSDTVPGSSIPYGDTTQANTRTSPFTSFESKPNLSGESPASSRVRTRPPPSETATLAWLMAVIILSALIVLRILWVRRLMRNCAVATRPDLVQLLERLRESLRISQPIDLRIAADPKATEGPVVIGVLRPKILIPAQIADQWAISEIEPLLLHELGHIKRRDSLMNWIQILVQLVYFFHPLVWFANWKIRRERELACDDLAVAHTERGKKHYTQSFLRMLEESKRGFALGLAGVGMTEPRNSIARRILRIMDQKYRLRGQLGRAWFVGLVFLSVILIGASADRSRGEDETILTTGKPEIRPPVPGGNNALLFDGVDDFVEIPEVVSLRTVETEPLTVEFWLLLTPKSDDWIKMFTKWGMWGRQDDEFALCIYQDRTFGFANTTTTGTESSAAIPTDVWCHICSVWDNTNQHFELYLNGEPVTEPVEGPSPLQLTGEPIRIGTDGHHDQWFCGGVDEVRMWNVARSQEEVKRDMNRKLSGQEPGLVGYWNFDEGTGQVIHDLTTTGNNGRLGRLPSEDGSDPKWAGSGVNLR